MRKPKRQFANFPKIREVITTEFEGTEISGHYELDGKMITVSYLGAQSDPTQLGGSASAPDSLARTMLWQLARELKERGL